MDFSLSDSQLLDIANDFREKIETGLKFNNTEIKALPTYIHPKKEGIKGEALVLDLGGTNLRAAVVSVDRNIVVRKIVEKNITEMKTPGFSQKDLHHAQLQLIRKLGNIPRELPLGYCFSYPARSTKNGDARLIKWVKGVNIPSMEGKAVGRPLLEYLNQNTDLGLTKITVVNDTITSLFSGVKNAGFDAYIGLIVGTGTNMAAFFHSQNIFKMNTEEWQGITPVNLESGNYNPPYLSVYDDAVDKYSDNQGMQRFEKAVSGMYLGQILKAIMPDNQLPKNFDAAGLSYMINHPEAFNKDYTVTAFQIYERSAKLVAATLAGLIKKLMGFDPNLRRVQVLAEGSLFWNNSGIPETSYSAIVETSLNRLLKKMKLPQIDLVIFKMENANLIGAAITALSEQPSCRTVQ